MLWIVAAVITMWPLLEAHKSTVSRREVADRYFALIRGGVSKESAEHHPTYLRALERAEEDKKSRNGALKIALPIVAVLVVIQTIFRI